MSACLKLCVSLSSLFTLFVSPYLLQITLFLLLRFIQFSFLARRDFVDNRGCHSTHTICKSSWDNVICDYGQCNYILLDLIRGVAENG